MADDQRSDSQPDRDDRRKQEEDEEESDADSSSSDDSSEDDPELDALLYSKPDDEPSQFDAETNFKIFSKILDSKQYKKRQEEEEKKYIPREELWNFPNDPEKWREEDLKELWGDAPLGMKRIGWDPAWADEDEMEVVEEEMKEGRDPPIAPFYVPYRKPYPVIPDNHVDISNPKAVIEELDRIEEFLKWVSYIFQDGSTYEGTVWDDCAHGKGVYVAEHGLVRYEGEWLQNEMDGHGVVEVDIPGIEPVPGSKLEAKMRAEGKIIKRDYMTPEDREWLEMDIDDCVTFTDGQYEVPLHEKDGWIKIFGSKPEKGRYRYAGQWKQGRMHGCGLYEVNERMLYGRFYFGELLDDLAGCDEDISAMHAGIAEVAAAKARMFVNKPDGMVREERGPYGDPAHPYFYEDEDAWMAPGFINQFYEVPDYWKTYMSEVDQEREMWLNSFYKAPLRLPMPAELEHWWSKDEDPEFILVNKEPEPEPEDPSKLIYTTDPLILHTPSGRLINYIEDEEHGVRLFWQPPLKDGEDVDPEKAEFLPLGYDDFFGVEVEEEKNIWKRLITAVDNALKPALTKLEKWVEEKKKAGELQLKLVEKELDLVEAEICLEEAIEDFDEELKEREKAEQNRMETELEEDVSLSPSQQDKATSKENMNEEAEEDEEEEEEEDELAPSSFGSASSHPEKAKNDLHGNKPRGSPFSSLSLSFTSCSLFSVVPSTLQRSNGRLPLKSAAASDHLNSHTNGVVSVSFPSMLCRTGRLRAVLPERRKARHHSVGRITRLHSLCKILFPSTTHLTEKSSKVARNQHCKCLHAAPTCELCDILSLHIPLNYLEPYTDTIKC